MGPGGSSNLFLEMFTNRNRKSSFQQACVLDLFEWDGHQIPYTSQHCDYVVRVNNDFKEPFRIIEWPNHTAYLKELVDSVKPNSIWIGSNLPDTVGKIKEQFGDDVITMSVNYNDYGYLYERWVKYQIGWLLKRTENVFDSYEEAEKYCRNVGPEYFGYSIPKVKDTKADHIIDIRDIFDKNTFKNFLSELNCECWEDDWEFYDSVVENS